MSLTATFKVKRTIPISAWTRWEEQGGMYTDSKVKMFGSVEPSMPMNYSVCHFCFDASKSP
eukprot:748820-Hanusia_phi.AAC.3